MANRERGEFDLAAGDKTYRLKLSTNALAELENQGQTFDELQAKAAKGSIVAIRWIIWAALQTYHAEECASAKDAGRIIDECGGIFAIGRQMTAFMEMNAPDPEDRKPAAVAGAKGGESSSPFNAQDASTGADSSSTPVASA